MLARMSANAFATRSRRIRESVSQLHSRPRGADIRIAFSYTRGVSHRGTLVLNIVLTLNETRVLGSLMEKSVITPDQYPLTLNALMLACNQKSSRDPVLSLDQGTVQHTARELENKHLISSEENFRGRVVKYTQRFCNTPFAELQLSGAEFAVMCLLLLRGRQTPGELRARSGRLHEFTDNAEVEDTLQGMIEHEKGPLVARLPMTPGRKDFEYMHVFGGALQSVDAAPKAAPPRRAGSDRIVELEARVDALEQEMRALKLRLPDDTSDAP
jgi:uncharacterized protein